MSLELSFSRLYTQINLKMCFELHFISDMRTHDDGKKAQQKQTNRRSLQLIRLRVIYNKNQNGKKRDREMCIVKQP